MDPEIYKLPDPFLLQLRYHINMICRACAAGPLLKLLFQDDPDTGGSAVPAEGDRDNTADEDSDNADYDGDNADYDSDYASNNVREFNEFLISSALEQHIISRRRAQMWREYLNGNEEDDSSGSCTGDG